MKTSVLVVTMALAVLAAKPLPAADLVLAPANVTMRVATGESASTTIAGSVNTQPPVPFTMTLLLRPVGGSMPAPWLIAQPASFTNRSTVLMLPFSVKVPANASPGTYHASVRPQVLASSIPIVPPSQPVQLSITVTSNCSASPAVAISSTQPAAFKAPNGRLADVSVAGNIVVPLGCTLARAWYTLADEYGIFDEATVPLAADPDGSFAFIAPVQVSRRGDDKDGRAYRFTVFAADEAGTGSSAPAAVVVRHDQRKEE